MSGPPGIDRVIVLNCYGRGGSGILWRMIGSSPDVAMTVDEWHVAVFGRRRIPRKLAVRTFRHLGIKSFEPLRRYALRKTLQTNMVENDVVDSAARACVIKLMDYHVVFAEMISRSFAEAAFVNLTRHPYGQCESLLRSGLDLRKACRWYTEVARLMADGPTGDTVSVRFEDLVTHPVETCDALYGSLGVRWASDGRFVFKVKPYGAHRTAQVDVRDGELIRIGPEDVRRHIDASVLRGEQERLSGSERRAIWRLTENAARRFGYDEAGSHR